MRVRDCMSENVVTITPEEVRNALPPEHWLAAIRPPFMTNSARSRSRTAPAICASTILFLAIKPPFISKVAPSPVTKTAPELNELML